MSADFEHLDFEIEKEVWNRYELVDGAELRARVVVLKVLKKKNIQNPGALELGGETKVLNTVLPRKGYKLFGTPTSKIYTPEEIQSAQKIDVGFNQITEDWNIYRLDDGSKFKVKLVVANVKRLSIYDQHGLPIYNVDSTIIVNYAPKSS